MMRLFRDWVIGGASGSREGAWFILIVSTLIPVNVIVAAEFMGHPMPTAVGLLIVVAPAALAIWSAAHGLQKLVDNGILRKRDIEPTVTRVPEPELD